MLRQAAGQKQKRAGERECGMQNTGGRIQKNFWDGVCRIYVDFVGYWRTGMVALGRHAGLALRFGNRLEQPVSVFTKRHFFRLPFVRHGQGKEMGHHR